MFSEIMKLRDTVDHMLSANRGDCRLQESCVYRMSNLFVVIDKLLKLMHKFIFRHPHIEFISEEIIKYRKIRYEVHVITAFYINTLHKRKVYRWKVFCTLQRVNVFNKFENIADNIASFL